MNILLVFPTKLDKDEKPIKYKKGFLPPLSLALLNRLTPKQHKVLIVNDFVEDIDFSSSYDLVGITAMTGQVERAYQIADKFRASGTKVIIGGVHATLLPQEAKKHSDAVVIGEAENIWEQIVSDCESNNLKEFYKDNSYPDLQNLLIPQWDNMDLNIYPRPMGRKLPMMPIFTTRGCPFNCKYCTVTKFFGKSYRTKPIDNVIREIETTNAEQYFFVDDNIAGKPDYSRELFKALSRKNIRWFSQISTTVLKNPDLIDLAAKSGCTCIFIGIESINNKSLKSVNKGFNKFEEYAELFARFRKAGIVPYPSIIFGFDDETNEVFRKTIDFLMENKVGYAAFFLLTPLPGTTLYEEMKNDGRLLHRNWSLYDASNIVFQTKGLSINELYKNYWKTYQTFYSLKNITKRIFYNFQISSSPFNSLIEDLFFQFFFRKVVNSFEHPFSGGVNKIVK